MYLFNDTYVSRKNRHEQRGKKAYNHGIITPNIWIFYYATEKVILVRK
jgi:hypothetical protein